MADLDPKKNDAQVVVLPPPKGGPKPPSKVLPTAEEVVAASTAQKPPIDPTAIIAKAQAATPRAKAAPPAPAPPVTTLAAPPVPAAPTPAPKAPVSETTAGRAAFDHHMTVRKGELVKAGMAQNKAHNQALQEWKDGQRIGPPATLRRAGMRVVESSAPPPVPANADRAAAFRAQIAGVAQLLARCADRRGAPITMKLLPESDEGPSWLILTIGEEPGTVLEVQDEVEKAGVALGAILREWDTRHAAGS